MSSQQLDRMEAKLNAMELELKSLGLELTAIKSIVSVNAFKEQNPVKQAVESKVVEALNLVSSIINTTPVLEQKTAPKRARPKAAPKEKKEAKAKEAKAKEAKAKEPRAKGAKKGSVAIVQEPGAVESKTTGNVSPVQNNNRHNADSDDSDDDEA